MTLNWIISSLSTNLDLKRSETTQNVFHMYVYFLSKYKSTREFFIMNNIRNFQDILWFLKILKYSKKIEKYLKIFESFQVFAFAYDNFSFSRFHKILNNTPKNCISKFGNIPTHQNFEYVLTLCGQVPFQVHFSPSRTNFVEDSDIMY